MLLFTGSLIKNKKVGSESVGETESALSAQCNQGGNNIHQIKGAVCKLEFASTFPTQEGCIAVRLAGSIISCQENVWEIGGIGV